MGEDSKLLFTNIEEFCVKSDTDNVANTRNLNNEKLSVNLKEKLQNFPDIYNYIKALEKQVKRHKRKLKKMKTKLKHCEFKSIGVQTELSNDDVTRQCTCKNENATVRTIADQIKEAAQLATQNTGFLYDENMGMYYDSNTGYYYNSEYGLYYDFTTSTYLSYKQETNTYEFHSQVYVPRPQENHKYKEHKQEKKSKDETKASKYKRLASLQINETEEGECSVSSSPNESSDDDDETNSDNSELPRSWPPCMRIIVEQSRNQKIKIGTLYLLTYEGGSLGREGNHDIVIADINISKCHLKFTFDKDKNGFLVTDLGSRNGTILNGKRMSSSKQESETLEVAHGSRIQIGSIVLLCHIHEGNQTCGHCEPGLIQINESKKPEALVQTSKSEQHKNELKKLRKKFGVNVFDENITKLASGYMDRARKRRQTVGSQNDHEKTKVASLDESISSQNKGFKLLEKMGWKEGQSLGRDNQGILEPIAVSTNAGTSGIGCTNVVEAFVNNYDQTHIDKGKQMIWRKTQERFKKLSATNVFQEVSD